MPLPTAIQAFFWEYAEGTLTWPDSKETIIPKLLRDGGRIGVDYLLNAMSEAELRDWVLSRDMRGIPPAQLRRLQQRLALPADWVTERVTRHANNVWGRRSKQ